MIGTGEAEYFGTGGGSSNSETFLSHVFSTTTEGKGEIFNILQYAGLAIIPILILNKIIQKFIPDADIDKPSFEILLEVVVQLIIIFIAIVIIHRIITYVPTFSGMPYGNFLLTSSVLSFLIIVLSIQTKLGIKVNILVDRIIELVVGHPNYEEPKQKRRIPTARHNPSQADYLDSPDTQNDVFPPAPSVNSRGGNAGAAAAINESNPVAANSLLGTFGNAFF